MMTGVGRIAAERERQRVGEGYTAAHDDRHDDATLVAAACCYAALARRQADGTVQISVEGMPPPVGWPWDIYDWKPSNDPARNLVKAGALLAAEIDRLQRAALGKS